MRHTLHAQPEDIEGGAAALAAHLDAAPSVTAGLLSWCEARGIGDGPVRVLACARAEPPEDLARLLGASGEPALFRRVVLGRGRIALAEAENLFLPSRLPAPMRQALAVTDIPFGAVLAPLRPSRRTLWRRAERDGAVLAQAALVVGQDGAALAAVHERFLPALLGR